MRGPSTSLDPIRVGAPSVKVPAGAQVFTGKSLGGFSGANTLKSAIGDAISWGPGKSIAIVWHHVATPATTQTLVSSYHTASFHGWEVALHQTAGLNVTSDVTSGSTGLAAIRPGINRAVLVWRAADSAILCSINGSALTAIATIAGPTTSGIASWQTYLGTPATKLAGVRNPLASTTGRLIAVATVANELSAPSARAITHTTGNRYRLSVAGSVFDFQVSRDFAGASFTTGAGSQPMAFTLAGTLATYALAERRILADPWFAGSYRVRKTAPDGAGFSVRAPLDVLRLVTDDASIAVETYSDWIDLSYLGAADACVGLYVGGSYVGETAVTSARQTPLISLGVGAAKQVQIVLGPTFINDYYDNTVHRETTIEAVRVSLWMPDGVTPTNTALVVPPTVAHKLLILTGGHELVGIDPGGTYPVQGNLTRDNLPARLRATYGGEVGVYDADQIYQLGHTAEVAASLAATAAAFLTGTSSNTVWIAAGIQDWYDQNGVTGVGWSTAADYQTNLARLVDAIHAAAPDALIVKSTAVQSKAPLGEAYANSFGSILPEFRTADAAVVAARSGWMVLDDWSAGAVIADADIYSDGMHPLASAWPKMHDRVRATLTAIGGRGY